LSAVSIADLEKRYGRAPALCGIALELERGSSTLVAGPNGAGKSTLLRLIAGLARPTRGQIRVLGVDPLAPQGREVRSRIGYLGVQPGLYGELSVRENLEFCARLQGRPRACVARALAQLELEAWAERPLRTLSFGYQRRAGLARALLGDPELLLFDEPWNGLDDRSAEALSALLQEARERGATLIVAAHGAPKRDSLFDRRLQLEAGRLVAG
jgi:heme ABC exporter ATP-binding subunit CcmA